MTTFFLDLEGGNDANDGTTFANRWKTITSGATAARIGPGDTVRVMASPDPTSMGSCTWHSPTVARNNKSLTILSTTNTSPIVVTTSTEHGFETGQSVRVTSAGANTAALGLWPITVLGPTSFSLDGSTGIGTGAGGGVYDLRSHDIDIPAGLVQNIACHGNKGSGRTAWTAAANVSVGLTVSSVAMAGDGYDQINIGSGFTTGKAAYKTLDSVMDLSAYQQISLLLNCQSSASFADGQISIVLCSDTTGDTPVNNFPLPATNITGVKMPVTVDFGSALGSAIQSVALYVNSDFGAQTFLLENIIACKATSAADSISLTSLIGKNVAGETWWPITVIIGQRLLTGSVPSDAFTTNRGYFGVTESVATYKRETTKTTPLAGSSVSAHTMSVSGVSGNLITLSGGWNRTDMSTQTGETVLDGQNGSGNGIQLSGQKFLVLDRVCPVRYTRGFGISNSDPTPFTDIQFTNFFGIACVLVVGGSASCHRLLIDQVSFIGCNGVVIFAGNYVVIGTVQNYCGNSGNLLSTGNGLIVGEVRAGNIAAGIIITSLNAVIGSVSVQYVIGNSVGVQLGGNEIKVSGLIDSQNNGTTGLLITGRDVKINAVTCKNNGTAEFGMAGKSFVKTATLSGKMLVDESYGLGPSAQFQSLNGCYPVGYFNGGRVQATKTPRHTESGYAWDFRPTSTSISATSPLEMTLATFACAADVEKTCTIWVRRDNTNIKGQLLLRGGQIAGVTSDVTTACEPTMDTWTQYTLTFTPIEDGVVKLVFQAWDGVGTSNHLIIDDLEINP